MHNLPYDQAMHAALHGEMIARAGWPTDNFVFQRPHDVLDAAFIPKVKSLPEKVKDFLSAKGVAVLFTGYLCLHTGDCIQNGWAPTALDQEAADWRILD